MLLQEIYELEDCTYYNSGKITGSQTLPIQDMSANFYASFTICKISHNNALSWLNVGADSDNCLFFGQVGANALGMFKRQNGSNTAINYNNVLTSTNTDYLIEFEYVDGVLTLKGNNTSLTGNWSYPTRSHISTNIQTNNSMTGLKIKPL